MIKNVKLDYIPTERKLFFFDDTYVFDAITEKESQIINELVSYAKCLYDAREVLRQKIQDVKTAIYK